MLCVCCGAQLKDEEVLMLGTFCKACLLSRNIYDLSEEEYESGVSDMLKEASAQ